MPYWSLAKSTIRFLFAFCAISISDMPALLQIVTG
jgi:hypothetical protein